MNKQHFYILALLIIASCSNATNPKEQFLKRYKKGIIIDKVECGGTNDQSYCLYLPSAYDINKSFPVIYAFDPHADGHLPVALLTEVAEKYNYIVVGSNNSRNGLSADVLNDILNHLLSDSKTKLAIDSNNIYLIGFSGGARVAAYVAQSIEGVKAVVGCSAGIQLRNAAPAFTFIGISSYGDMNYLEMKQTQANLQQLNAKSELLVFNGKHEWPPKSTLNEAFDILEFYKMKTDSKLINGDLIAKYLKNNLANADILKNYNRTDSLIKAFVILKKTIAVLDKIGDISKAKEKLDEIANNTEIKKYLNEEKELEIYEARKQQEFLSAFDSKNDAWWNNELKLLDIGCNNSNMLISNTSYRLKAHISLSCYSYSMRALQTQNWKLASLFTHIYQKVDPENPDCYYALACLYANINQKEKAIEALKTAIKYGFSNLSKMQNDALLSSLHGLAEFDNLINK